MEKTINRKTKILYFTAGIGAGGVYRALALYKAIGRLGLSEKIDFMAASVSDYNWLLAAWNVPHVIGAKETNLTVFLQEVLDVVKPDVLISNYHIHAVQSILWNYSDIAAWLLLRQFKDIPHYLQAFDSKAWDGVVAIEPNVSSEIVKLPKFSAWLEDVPPVLSVWPDEILPKEEARTALFDYTHVYDSGVLPLRLVVHNGAGREEAHHIFKQVQTETLHRTLYFSQTREGYVLQEPIARYFQGVDYLVAAPGYNTYWEWMRYSRPDAKVLWLGTQRGNEDVLARAAQLVDRSWLYNQPNGAEVIIKRVLA